MGTSFPVGNKMGMCPWTLTMGSVWYECQALWQAGWLLLCKVTTAWGSLCLGKQAHFPNFCPYKCPWCQREKNLLPCGMAGLCQLCCWMGFNDNFLHIPHKTPLQMGCHSRNSIWELGCRSEAAQSWQSGSLTWQDCSWDPQGWAAEALASLSGPLHEYAGWTWGRLVLLSGGSRNLILFASSLQSLDTRFALTPAKAACRHPRQLWPFQ